MRRSKSDPAKYARNYRKISQRRMTQYDGLDEEKEMERLRSELRNSERQLKEVDNGGEVADATNKSNRKRNRSTEDVETGVLTNASAILSPELTSELRGYGRGRDENPLVVLPSKKKKKKDKKNAVVQLSPEEIREAKVTQKKITRKLQQLETRAAQKKKRAELYKRLEDSQVVPQSTLQPLLQSSGKLSRKDSTTKKQALKKLLTKERAGLTLTSDERELLFPEYEVEGEEEGDDVQIKKALQQSATFTPKMILDNPMNGDQKVMIIQKTINQKTDVTKDTVSLSTTELSSKPKAMVSSNLGAPASKEAQGSTSTSNGADFASLMMASLSKLSTENINKSGPASDNTLNDLSTDMKSTKRYIPANPTVVKTAASMGITSRSSGGLRARSVLNVKRPACVQKSRFDLPVTAMEFEIIDAVRNNDVTIVCGETGSGKSTQVPTFLYEAGMTLSQNGSERNFMVGITQPRRVAAVSTAKRVCFEMGQGNGQTIRGSLNKGNLVAYQTRYETAGLGDSTHIKFMTDGILLNEIQNDLLLRRYSVIVLDESHERNLNTDVLIGLLSASLPLRKKASLEDPSIVPLKVILMSATLRVEDFTKNEKLFSSCTPAVVTVPGRTHPVTIHHSKITELDDYETAVFKKVCKIHRKLPRGGILVFLTGKGEIVRMVKRLQNVLNGDVTNKQLGRDVGEEKLVPTADDFPREMDDEEYDGEDTAEDSFNNTENFFDDSVIPASEDESMPTQACILPLYSLLSAEDQSRVFAPVPDNHRLIVVATNVAETSITIPGITYVVDTGRQKCRNYNSGTGVASYDIMWISKAAADQRSGRAGRTGPGHCYRLYSSSLYARHMDPFALPEVLTRPLEDVALAMKAMKISNISTFPFPTPPDRSQIEASVKLLADLGCLDLSQVERDGGDGSITRLGLAVSKLPLGVRYAKMLLVAAHAGVLDYSIVAVAALSETSPFSPYPSVDASLGETKEQGDESVMDEVDTNLTNDTEKRKARSKKWYHTSGDVFAAISAVGAFTFAGKGVGGASEILATRKFCEENCLNFTIMSRIQRTRMHLASLARKRMGTAKGIAATSGSFSHKMPPPNKLQERLLMQSIASGLLDRVAFLAPPGSIPGQYPVDIRSAYIGSRSTPKEPLFVDRGSSVYSKDYRQLPRWVCYESLIRKITKEGSFISVMKNVTPVDPQWLGEISRDTRMVTLGAAVGTPPPIYDAIQDVMLCSMTTQYGSNGWIIPPVRVVMYDALTSSKGKASPDFLPGDSFRWFARFLWEGKVMPELAVLVPFMNDSSELITRNRPSAKVSVLVESLRDAGVDCASALRKHWADHDEKFLLKCVKSWVKPEHHKVAKKVWIDVVRRNVQQWKEENL